MREYFETHTEEQVWKQIQSYRSFFWPGARCAIVGQIINHPIGIKSFNYWLQGGDLDELLTMHPGIEAWAKERVRPQPKLPVTGIGREGWSRAMHGEWQKGPTTRIKWL